ncbi:MAG: hypothetical protein WD081_07195 [Gammaproteobacteria bacterium]
MRTKPIIVSLLVLLAIAVGVAWHEYRKVCCAEQPVEAEVEAAPGTSDADLGGVPDPIWDEAERPVTEASPEGLYNDLKAASEDAHRKPSLEIERVPPPALPAPTRGEDDDPA